MKKRKVPAMLPGFQVGMFYISCDLAYDLVSGYHLGKLQSSPYKVFSEPFGSTWTHHRSRSCLLQPLIVVAMTIATIVPIPIEILTHLQRILDARLLMIHIQISQEYSELRACPSAPLPLIIGLSLPWFSSCPRSAKAARASLLRGTTRRFDPFPERTINSQKRSMSNS